MRLIRLASMALLLAAPGPGCSKQSPSAAVTVEVSPATATVEPLAQKTFSATVIGASNLTVTWTVQEGSPGGGTIDSGGVYTAPAAASTYHVVATSVQDTSASGSAAVTVTAVVPTVTVSVSPGVSFIGISGTVSFTATVTGNANTSVTWSVQEGSPGGGTIDSGGHYTAPASPGTYHVVATSVADNTASDTATVNVAASVIPADRATTWSPGIPGGIPNRTTLCATVTPAYATAHSQPAFDPSAGTGDASGAIQFAIDHCAANDVVYLPTGTYRITQSVNIKSSIVLRGDGPTLTKIRQTNANDWVIALWGDWPTWGSPVNVTGNIAKDATSMTVSSAAGFAVGDTIFIDQTDDTSYLFEGMSCGLTGLAACPGGGSSNQSYFKRGPQSTGSGGSYGPTSPGNLPRSMGQATEITAISGTTISFSPAAYMAFNTSFAPQMWKAPHVTRNAGIEELYVTGGTDGNIFLQDCSYCWVKHVESDGTVSASPASNGTLGSGNGETGDHLNFTRAFRCEVRESYIHHATHVVQGGGAYGITFTDYSTANLVENNIIFYMNKPVSMRAAGGGNVVGYNYIDDAWTSADDALQETTLDLGHSSFPHFELVEGNYVPQIATENVWGNSGFITIFRNFATGQQERTNAFETYQIAAISLEVKARDINVVGNVLGTSSQLGFNTGSDGLEQYEVTSAPPAQYKAAVFRIGQGIGAGFGTDDIDHYENPASSGSAYSQLLRVGNWDNVRNQIDTAAAGPLPASLYLSAKPAFFGSSTWPWVEPAGATRVFTLPAKARFDACKSGTPSFPSYCP